MHLIIRILWLLVVLLALKKYRVNMLVMIFLMIISLK
jgi:hypothetical protein